MFSPSLRASTNSLFAPAGEEHLDPTDSSEKHQSPPRALAIAGDNESDVIVAPSSALANGGGTGGGVGTGASAIEAGAVVSSRNGALAAAPGSTAGGVSSSPPAARGAVSSPQDKDFVEEVSGPGLSLWPTVAAAKSGWTGGWVGRFLAAVVDRKESSVVSIRWFPLFQLTGMCRGRGGNPMNRYTGREKECL